MTAPLPRVSAAYRRPTWGDRLRRFWDPPDEFLIDAGKSGELLIAKIRLVITGALLLIPVANLALAPAGEREQHRIGFFITLFAVTVAGLVYLLVTRDRRQRWLSLATSALDVTLVSFALVIYGLDVDPLQSVNSLVTFETYYIAIAGTCLRYDKRVALVAGLLAMVEYLAIVVIVNATFSLDRAIEPPGPYGTFAWSNQVSRLILLGAMTALAVYVVGGMQRQRELSTADPLTGAFNRRFFDDYFATEVERATRYNTPFAVAMIDVDHFKDFNDTYGHAAGDRVLRTVARVLQGAVRRSDLVARYGGEEFVVLFRETDAEQAFARVDEVRCRIAAEPLLVARGAPARITVSAGVSSWPGDGLEGPDLLARADLRLFKAKDAGRNRVVGPPLEPGSSVEARSA